MELGTTYNLMRATRAAMVLGPLAVGALNMLVHGAGAEQVQDGLVRILGGWDGTPAPADVQVFGYDGTGVLHPINDIAFHTGSDRLDVTIQNYGSDPYAKYHIAVSGIGIGHGVDVTDAQLANGPAVDNHISQNRTEFNNYMLGFLGFIGAVSTPIWLPRVIRGVKARLSR